ncbi:MAG: hypothetical protein AB1805_06990 [Nitrospirota bacterium]
MRIAAAVLAVMSAIAAAVWYGIPVVIERETADLRQRLERIEAFIRNEEEARKAAVLPPDADAQKILKAVNALAARTSSLERSVTAQAAAAEETLQKQREARETALKQQAEALESLKKETAGALQRISFEAKLAAVRGHIAKARTDLLSKNVTTARNEMELIDAALERMKTAASGERKKSIEELQATLRKAREEADANLSAALSRIDLLWHETSRMLMSSL